MAEQTPQLFPWEDMGAEDKMYARRWLMRRQEQEQEPLVKKRGFFNKAKRVLATTAIAAGAAFQVSNVVTEAAQTPKEGWVEVVETEDGAETNEAASDSMWFVLPGTNVDNSWHIAEPLLPSLEESGQVAAMEYDEPYSFEAVYGQIVEFAQQNDINSINLYGQSHGGAIALEAAGKLYEEHGIEVPMVVLDCTPLRLGHTDLQALNNDLAISLFQTGIFSRPSAELTSNYAYEALAAGGGGTSWMDTETFIQALERMQAEESILTYSTIQKMIDLAFYDFDAVVEKLPPRTSILYIAPRDPAADPYVHTVEVIKDLAGKPRFKIARLNIDSHASPWRSPEAYNEAITDFTEEAAETPRRPVNTH